MGKYALEPKALHILYLPQSSEQARREPERSNELRLNLKLVIFILK